MSVDKQIFISDPESRRNLAKRMNLEYDETMQDWEYEISDYTRISEFIEEYENPRTTDKERQSLMEIIIDCLNDLLQNKHETEFENYIHSVQKLLDTNSHLHTATIHYWCENDFFISKFLKI